MSTAQRSRPDDLLVALSHLTSRDRQLLTWLDEHPTLTTGQIATALFPSLRAAQKRLTTLHRHRFVDRFTFAHDPDSPSGMRYILGPIGHVLHPDPAGRSLQQRHADLIGSPDPHRILAVNGFFTDLLGHARTHPDTELRRWWSRHHTGLHPACAAAGIRPDGHGVWHRDGHTVGFFLHHIGPEPAARSVDIAAYGRFIGAGRRYPVLLSLATTGQEANLHRNLAGIADGIPIATAIHGTHPAADSWALIGHDGPRLRLDQLPFDSGPDELDNAAPY